MSPENSGIGGAGAFKALIISLRSWMEIFERVDLAVSWLCVGLIGILSCVIPVLGAECNKSVQNAVEAVSAVLALSGLSMLSRLGATGFC